MTEKNAIEIEIRSWFSPARTQCSMIAEENKHKSRAIHSCFLWWPAGLRYSTDPPGESKNKVKKSQC